MILMNVYSYYHSNTNIVFLIIFKLINFYSYNSLCVYNICYYYYINPNLVFLINFRLINFYSYNFFIYI